MEELSIEEKAKRYDEAKLRMSAAYNSNRCTIGFMNEIFPELKESEDERILKIIKETLKSYNRGIISGSLSARDYTDCLAWLEKQGKNNMGISEATKQKLEDNLNKALEKETPESCNGFLDEQGEQKPVEEYNITGIGSKHAEGKLGEMIKNLKPVNEVLEQNPADKVEPKFHEGDMIIHKELGGDYIHNPHKIIQVDIVDKKYRLEGGLVAHFGEQDDYELVEQNSAWSAEDEKILNLIIARLHSHPNVEVEEYGKDYHWLKSLKERIKGE